MFNGKFILKLHNSRTNFTPLLNRINASCLDRKGKLVPVFPSFLHLTHYYIFSSEVRLQFRLPDGSSLTQNFAPEALLETAREFICSVRMSLYLFLRHLLLLR